MEITNSFSISELNLFVGDRCLRKYQDLIIDNINFSVSIDGEDYLFIRSEAIGDSNRLLFRGDLNNLVINTGEAGNGYEILVDKISEYTESISNESFHNDGACIVVGHWNFAHFMWNQLSAFNFVKNRPRLSYFSIRDSFGTCTDIFELKEKSVTEKYFKTFQNSLFIGGTYLNADTHLDIMKFIDKETVLYPLPKNSQDYTCIYIGVRGSGTRELEDEVDFYVALINRLSKYSNKFYFYIDGFSFLNSNNDISDFQKRNSNISNRIQEIISLVETDNINSINGLHICHSLAYIKNIDYYITHEGTMQHKIGWFFKDKPGLILTGSAHQNATAQWHADQVEGALKPDTLGESLIRPFNNGNRDSSFSILDISNAVDLTFNKILNAK